MHPGMCYGSLKCFFLFCHGAKNVAERLNKIDSSINVLVYVCTLQHTSPEQWCRLIKGGKTDVFVKN